MPVLTIIRARAEGHSTISLGAMTRRPLPIKRQRKFESRDIETDACSRQEPISRSRRTRFCIASSQVPQASVLDHDALRRSGGA